MSGFIGLVAPVITNQHERIIDRCHNTITKTCSDFSGQWNSAQVDLRFGLFRAIEDTDQEELPYTKDQNLRIIGDVRLDNRNALIHDLNETFPYLNSNFPDSYILLHAYMVWGEACLNRISGDYSFAIWNEEERTLFCARDHFGIIPFYYAQIDEGFIFTNYYSSLKEVPGLMDDLNEDVLKSYLVTGNDGSFSSTIYKKIKKLPPAHKLVYKKGKLELSRYWTPQLPKKLIRYKSTEDYITHFKQIFERAVTDRLRSNKVASQLSGGMDSSSVTAMAECVLKKNSPDNYLLVAYNVTYKSLVKENEGYYAKVIANYLGIELKQFVAEEYLSKLSLNLDSWIPEPVGILKAVPESAMVKDAANNSLNVLLTGFGADVLFNYDGKHWLKMLRTKYFFQYFLDLFHFIKTHGRLPSLGLARVLLKIIKQRKVQKINVPDWLNSEYVSEDYLASRNESFMKCPLLGLSTNSFWQSIFEHSHQGFSENRVKVRHPFFSLELQEFLLAIPPHLLYNKYLLRLSMQSFLPLEVLSRPKTLLYGGAHLNNLKSSGVLNELISAVKENQDLLRKKIDVPALILLLQNPQRLKLIDHTAIISLIYILAWKKIVTFVR